MLETGQMLQDRYRIVASLGQGGMGAVYRAWDTRLSVSVAIKEMIPQPDVEAQALHNLRAQFKQEATVLARLNHPYLVGVTDFFEDERNVYLVMKFVEGESLYARIQRDGAIPEAQVIAWCQQLLDALGYCHSQGIIHRDIKPQNIIIRPGGDAVLVDFGLVKLWNPDNPQTRTAVRGIGTPQYAPPEQYEMDAGHTEPRSDLYSLGATMYHALTGQAPPTATMRIAAPEDDAPLRTVAPHVSARTAQVIDRAMALARSKRWSSPTEMAQALNVKIRDWGGLPTGGAAAAAALDGRGGTVRMRTSRLLEARRWPVWLLALLVLAFLLSLGSLVLGASWVIRELSPAVTPTLTATLTATVTPTASPTLTPSSTPTPTPSPTATETPEETLAPTETPTETPTPTATAVPTATPTPAGATSPTATPPPTTDSGAFINFEQWGAWQRGDQPYGDLTQTQEQVKSGNYAAKLTYNFPGSGEDYVIFMQQRALSGTPNTFAAWVYGDGSNHYVNLWIRDAQGQVWSVHLGRVRAAGWQQLSGRLEPGLPWPSGHISGPDNGVVDYPVSFYALVLDRPNAGPLQGHIYLDDLSAWRSNTPAPTPVAPTAPPATSAPPPPGGSQGSLVFTVRVDDAYFLYSTDPTWSQMVEIGKTDWSHSTCSGGATASTLAGTSVNLYGQVKCAITGGTDVCTSPDGNYKLISSSADGQNKNLLLHNVNTGEDVFYFTGNMNRAVGIVWSYDSRYAIFADNRTVNIIQPGVPGYRQLIPFIEDTWPPQFSPDSSRVYYLQPVGAEGASDVFIIHADGSGARNLTNAPIAYKLCPRWRR